MRSYIGAKIINAKLMTYGEYRKAKSGDDSIIEDGVPVNLPGYMVIYPPVGNQEKPYISWSPKHVFENAYRLVLDSEKSLIVSGQ